MGFQAIYAGILSGSGGGAPAPVSLTAPQIVSSMVVGVSMAVTPGTYSGTVTSRGYQWRRGGVAISGATSATYAAVSGDAQGVITVDEIASNGGSAAAAATSSSVICAPASAAYATALAAVTDGQYFTAPHGSGYKYQIYQRLAGVGVLFDETPVSGAWNSVCAVINALAPMAVTPLFDFDSIDVAYGEYEFQSRISGAPKRTFNLLGGFSYANAGYTPQGSPTVNAHTVTDPWSGTSALELVIASGAAAASDIFIPTRCPPGTWTFSYWVKTTGAGATQAIKFGYNNTATVVAQTATGTWQQFSQTFNLTAETAIAPIFIHGDYPSAPSVAYQFAIAGLQITPGTVAPTGQPDTHPHPAVYTSTNLGVNGYTLESLTSGAANGNALVAKQATLTNLTAWTMSSFIRGDLNATAGALGTLAPRTVTGIQDIYSVPTTGFVGPYSKFTGQTSYGPHWANAGWINLTHVLNGTTLKTYINGVLLHTETLGASVGTVNNLAALHLNHIPAANVASPTFPFVGNVAGAQVYGAALTDAQVAAAHVITAARASAKGITLQVTKNVFIVNGDSIGHGYGEDVGGAQVPIGYESRATAQDASGTNRFPRISISNLSIVGEKFSQMVAAQLAQTLSQVVTAVANGINPIVSVEMGTNDDGTLITQAAVDAYYSTGTGFTYSGGSVSGTGGLKEYWAVLRANGAKVIVETIIPDGRTSPSAVPFDSTATGVIASGPLAGNSYTSWRAYLNARIAFDAAAYDGINDRAGVTQFNGASYATTNGSNPGAVYVDTLHPNSAGNVALQPAAAAAITALLV